MPRATQYNLKTGQRGNLPQDSTATQPQGSPLRLPGLEDAFGSEVEIVGAASPFSEDDVMEVDEDEGEVEVVEQTEEGEQTDQRPAEAGASAPQPRRRGPPGQAQNHDPAAVQLAQAQRRHCTPPP